MPLFMSFGKFLLSFWINCVWKQGTYLNSKKDDWSSGNKFLCRVLVVYIRDVQKINVFINFKLYHIHTNTKNIIFIYFLKKFII